MIRLRATSIRGKINGVVLASTTIALVLAVLAFLAQDWTTSRAELSRELTSVADMIGQNSRAALAFEDSTAAHEILSAVAAEPSILCGALYAADGRLFVSYRASERAPDLPSQRPAQPGHRYESSRLEILREINSLDGTVGAVILEADLGPLRARQARGLVLATGILLATLAIAFVLTHRLRGALVDPVGRLLATTRRVSAERDYSIRVAPAGNDEIGELVKGFNQMLAEIERSSAALARQQEHLEGLVVERTSDLSAANAALVIEKERAEAASRSKSEFLANMSHEIRTPMNGVLGLTEIVLESGLSSVQRQQLEMVRASGEALLTVINDILDFSKIEAGRIEVESIPFSLSETIEQTLRTVAIRAHQKALELTLDMDPAVPEAVRGDPGRIRQILLNLLGNALKFTERGEVGVRVRVAGPIGDRIRVRTEVFDTGIGIAPEKQRLIFEPFVQADGSMARVYGGTGLGLCISKRLLDLMGGTIGLVSEPGRGSTFTFELELAVAAGEHPASCEQGPRDPSMVRGISVLVVDDNATNRYILETVLRRWGMSPEIAAGGAEALERLARAVEERRPHRLVLTDAHMPGMDGFDLVEHVRSAAAYRGATILMLSSSGSYGDIGRCERLGVAGYLVKPITEAELWRAVGSALHLSVLPEAEAAPHSEAAPAGPRLRILVVEDNLINQKLAVALLEKRGHLVDVAADGPSALARTEGQTFDLVFMDVQMPGMSGLEATAAIREREERQGAPRIPIVALTAHAMKEDRERCLAAGMDDYLPKPIRPIELARVLSRFTRSGGADAPAAPAEGRSAGEGSCDASVRPAGSATRAQAEPEPVLDLDAALDLLGGDMELLAAVAAQMLSTVPELQGNLDRAARDGDLPALAGLAHSMRGPLGQLAARGACASAARTESLAREGLRSEALAAAAELQARLTELRPELTNLAARAAA